MVSNCLWICEMTRHSRSAGSRTTQSHSEPLPFEPEPNQCDFDIRVTSFNESVWMQVMQSPLGNHWPVRGAPWFSRTFPSR